MWRRAARGIGRHGLGRLALLWEGAAVELPVVTPTQLIPHRGKKSYRKKLIECLKTEAEHEKENYETDPIVKDGPPNDFALLELEGNLIVMHKKYQNEDITVKASFVEQPLPEKENPEDPNSAPLFDHPVLGEKRLTGTTVIRDPLKENFKYVVPSYMAIPKEGKYHHTFGWTMDQDPPKDPFYDPPLLEVSHTIMFTATIRKEGLERQLLLECETDGGYMSINHAGMESVNSPAESSDYTGPAFGELDETLQDTFNNWIEERGIDDVLGDFLVQKIHDIEQQHYQEWLENVQTFVEKEAEP